MTMKRREFFFTVTAAASLNPVLGKAPATAPANPPTITEFIERVLSDIPAERLAQTVDTIKIGSGEERVRGVATTFLATCDVIERAAAREANFLITHEPTFYNHLDETDWIEGDPVYERKRSLLQETGITVWRFHDYWHRLDPDPVNQALLEEMGLGEHPAEQGGRVCTIPEVSLSELAVRLRSRLGLATVRISGDARMPCRRLGIIPGAAGGRAQIAAARRHSVDVVICGEVNEWETNVYVEDSTWAGRRLGLIVLGHVNTEESGMRLLVDWLRPRFPGIPIHHVPMKDPFVWV